MPTPAELFAEKWPTVQRVVQFRASRGRLPRHDRDDLAQIAAMKLWMTALRKTAPNTINARLVASSAFGAWQRSRGRERVWEAPLHPRGDT